MADPNESTSGARKTSAHKTKSHSVTDPQREHLDRALARYLEEVVETANSAEEPVKAVLEAVVRDIRELRDDLRSATRLTVHTD